MRLRNRPGFTLPELLVALTITAVLGAAVTGLLVSQTRFFDTQEQLGNARAVSRGAVNMMFYELRMVEASGGVAGIGDTFITVRAPYAFGIACGTNLTTTIASLLPTDSVRYADAVLGGWAYRTGLRINDPYLYEEASVTLGLGIGGATVCDNARVTTLSAEGGRIIDLSPRVLGIEPGVPVFLYEYVRYRLDESATVSGAYGLYRDVLKDADAADPVYSEEIVAPVDRARLFRYYLNQDQEPVDAASVGGALGDIRGVEIAVPAIMQRRYQNRKDYSRVQTPTSVFFMNRTD